MEQPRHFLSMNALDPIWIEVLRFVPLWIVLCSCSCSYELRSATGDTHCVQTKELEVSNNFVMQEFDRSFLKLLFFTPVLTMSAFPNFVQKWKFQTAHGKVLLVVMTKP